MTPDNTPTNQADGPDKSQLHVPVLPQEVLAHLDPQAGDSYLDLTAGYGGHTALILERTKAPEKATLVDRDVHAVHALQERFPGHGIHVLQEDFLSASQQLVAAHRAFDLILADLGVSSPHLTTASRGFSLAQDGPLDMRMDQSQELSADKIINGYAEDELTDVLHRYGEEPKARAIARAIVAARPVHSTAELAACVKRVWTRSGAGHSNVHPATRTFQAIRIAVNDELRLIEQSVPLWIDLLQPGGRICIISFQSLEDRLVKQYFQDVSGDTYDAAIRLLTKRPITASHTELVSNPRSRSAKLRAAVKIK